MALYRQKTTSQKWGDRLAVGIHEARDGLGLLVSTYQKRSNTIFEDSLANGRAFEPASVLRILPRLYDYNRIFDDVAGFSVKEMDAEAKGFIELAADSNHQEILEAIGVANLATIEMYEHMREKGTKIYAGGRGNDEEVEILGRIDSHKQSLALGATEINSAMNFPTFFEYAYVCLNESSRILRGEEQMVGRFDDRILDAGIFVDRFNPEAEKELIRDTLRANRDRPGEDLRL